MYVTLQLLLNKCFPDLTEQGISCIKKIGAAPFELIFNRKPIALEKMVNEVRVVALIHENIGRKINTITRYEIFIDDFHTCSRAMASLLPLQAL